MEAIAATLKAITSTDWTYVSEDCVPLGSFRPDAADLVHFPLEWLERPPQLWGWRTNLEIAAEEGDVGKICDLCRTRSPAACRRRAAQRGRLAGREVLEEEVVAPRWRGRGVAPRRRLLYQHLTLDDGRPAARRSSRTCCGRGRAPTAAGRGSGCGASRCTWQWRTRKLTSSVRCSRGGELADMKSEGEPGGAMGGEAARKVLALLKNPGGDAACGKVHAQ